jgi:putative aminopeptidase FrvX
MTTNDLAADISRWSALFGPSGHEDDVIRAFVREVEAIGLKPTVDALGTVTVEVSPPQPGYLTFALTAHLDEVGFVVRDVTDAGWLSLYRIGGVHDRVVAGQRLRFRTESGDLIEGHVGIKGAHISSAEELSASVSVEDAYVDLLLPSRQAVLDAGVRVGSPGTFVGEFQQRGDLIRGKAFDDRIGIAVLLEVVRRLAEQSFGAGLTLIATVQEEFSMRAGVPAAAALQPDVLMCVDIALAGDSPDQDAGGPRLGAGPVLHGYTRGKSGGGVIPNPRLVRYLTDTASDSKIPLVHAALSGGLTDGSYMQYAGTGMATVDLAFPTRNAHTPVEVADLRDVENLVTLLTSAIAGAERHLTFERG